jgi:hypothetical protein
MLDEAKAKQQEIRAKRWADQLVAKLHDDIVIGILAELRAQDLAEAQEARKRDSLYKDGFSSMGFGKARD